MLSVRFLLVLISFAVVSLAQPYSEQELSRPGSVSQKIFNAFTQSGVREFFGSGPLYDIYDQESLLMAESVAFGAGTYEGEDIIKFMQLKDKEIDGKSATVTVTGASIDQAKNTAIVKTAISGVFKRTGKPFSTTVVHVFERDPTTRLVKFHVMIDSNLEETSMQYNSRASLLLKDLYWSMFESDKSELQDINSNLWQKISDDIQVTVHVDPKRIFPEDIGNVWEGKQEVLEGWQFVENLHKEMKKTKAGSGGSRGAGSAGGHTADKYENIQLKVLFEDDENVWVGIMCEKKLHALIHYKFPFEEQGKLGSEEIWLAKPVYPWQVYPWPTEEPDITPFSTNPLSTNLGITNIQMNIYADDEDDDDDDEDDDNEDEVENDYNDATNMDRHGRGLLQWGGRRWGRGRGGSWGRGYGGRGYRRGYGGRGYRRRYGYGGPGYWVRRWLNPGYGYGYGYNGY